MFAVKVPTDSLSHYPNYYVFYHNAIMQWRDLLVLICTLHLCDT